MRRSLSSDEYEGVIESSPVNTFCRFEMLSVLIIARNVVDIDVLEGGTYETGPCDVWGRH